LAAYSFPVQSMVISNNGSVITKLNANDLLDLSNKLNEKKSFMDATFMVSSLNEKEEQEDPISSVYLKFLNDGVTQQ